MSESAMIVLSGGLDSTVSLAYLKEKFDIKLAITFDYGQRAAIKEINASKQIADFYNIEHKVIELPWLKEITKTALVNANNEIPEPDISKDTTEAMNAVWVPNRNGAFLNIAASFCDSLNINYIIFGANKEEASTFPDNSQEFINNINKSLEYSTLTKTKIITPLIDFDKIQIVNLGVELNTPFHLIMSCYNKYNNHCGKCESCNRLKNALEKAGLNEILEKVFNAK
jgi:7-cyano-7-deazaguanine synthase